MICVYQNLPCFYNKILNLHWSNRNQMVSDKATMFIGRFHIITLKVMGEMCRFIIQGVFFRLDRQAPSRRSARLASYVKSLEV
jgi:hypothetical protein